MFQLSTHAYVTHMFHECQFFSVLKHAMDVSEVVFGEGATQEAS